MENSTHEAVAGAVDNPTPDRQDVSAEPEQPKLENPNNLTHNHKPNFGRPVAGCPRCEARASGIIPVERRGRPRKDRTAEKTTIAPPKPGGSVTVTYEQLQQMMAEMGRALGSELRKPDEETARKLAEEKERLELRKNLRMIEINAEQQAKLQREAMCESGGHSKENGRSAINIGQVYSDGLHHPFCCRCFKVFEPVSPARGVLT